MLCDGDTFEHDGRTFRFHTEHDDDAGPPWEREDGYGPVSEWTTRDKRPGELVLIKDGRSRRFYDFQEACRIARRDGWGWLPSPLTIDADCPDRPAYTACGGTAKAGPFTAYDPDNFNRAASAVCAMHRATMTPRAYAAAAAMRDFVRLRDWCNDRWSYVGVVVDLLDMDGEPTGRTASLWGIESDAGEYLEEVARDLTSEIDFARVVYVPDMPEARP